MELQFDAEIWRTGNVNVVTVPKAYLKHGLLDIDRQYQFIIRDKPQERARNGLLGILPLDLLSLERGLASASCAV